MRVLQQVLCLLCLWENKSTQAASEGAVKQLFGTEQGLNSKRQAQHCHPKVLRVNIRCYLQAKQGKKHTEIEVHINDKAERGFYLGAAKMRTNNNTNNFHLFLVLFIIKYTHYTCNKRKHLHMSVLAPQQRVKMILKADIFIIKYCNTIRVTVDKSLFPRIVQQKQKVSEPGLSRRGSYRQYFLRE